MLHSQYVTPIANHLQHRQYRTDTMGKSGLGQEPILKEDVKRPNSRGYMRDHWRRNKDGFVTAEWEEVPYRCRTCHCRIAKAQGILTIGIVTIPFYFEKKRKIIKALKGVEMRKNVDAPFIINNETFRIFMQTTKLLSRKLFIVQTHFAMRRKAYQNSITVGGDINLDSWYRDHHAVVAAIMAMGRQRVNIG